MLKTARERQQAQNKKAVSQPRRAFKNIKEGRNKMKYYLTVTARRKNAKRHIITSGFSKTFESIADAEKIAANLNKYYIVEIYNSKWELVKVIK